MNENYLVSKPDWNSDKAEIEKFVTEYNHLLDLIQFPTDGLYVAVVKKPVITRQTGDNLDYYVEPVAISLYNGRITNMVKGIDLSIGDIRLDSSTCYYNNKTNNCKNYTTYLKAMMSDREFVYSTVESQIIKTTWDINYSVLDKLRAFLLGNVVYIKFEKDRIVFPKDLNIPGTIDNPFYIKYPGIYVGYKGIRMVNSKESFTVFGSWTSPQEDKEVQNYNTLVRDKLHKIMSLYKVAHPDISWEEYIKISDQMTEKYNLYTVSRKYHYSIIQVTNN